MPVKVVHAVSQNGHASACYCLTQAVIHRSYVKQSFHSEANTSIFNVRIRSCATRNRAQMLSFDLA